jgi:hypothetical protein
MSRKNKILILVEGEKREVQMMKKMFSLYDLSDRHIVSYGANIYNLYSEMFENKNPEDYDLMQVLKSREVDLKKKLIFDEYYSDILLIFDLDPQDSNFQQEKLYTMQKYFSESSDMGKLYINYPMVESFYHMKTISDENFLNRCISFDELKSYKHIVSRETINRDYKKFAKEKSDFSIVILQNFAKALSIISDKEFLYNEIDVGFLDLEKVLHKQLKFLENEKKIYVLCTHIFYIIDYNPKLIIDMD